MSKTPISCENRTPLGRVHVNKEICSTRCGLPIGALPPQEEHGFVPTKSQFHTVCIGAHEGVWVPVANITVNGDGIRGGSLDRTNKKGGKKYQNDEGGLQPHDRAFA